MIKWLMTVFLLMTGNFLFAQQNLEINGAGSNLYLTHSVLPKESIYSVARMYNVNPKTLAAYNHLHIQSGLQLGQEIKIPLEKSNFTQSSAGAANEALVPVYHTIVAGETLYRLGVNYNKVPLASLKKWNHLASDEVSVGVPMIVGYLKVDKAQSSLANRQKPVPEPVLTVTPTPVKTESPATPAPVSEPKATVTSVNTTGKNNFSGGYFKDLFNRQVEGKTLLQINGTAGVFKSTSGWQDGKYYCFNNNAGPGTIVKVTNNGTGKSIYAKVLDAIPDIKQNAGLAVVISNAAAEELGAGEGQFECGISY